MFAKTDSRGSGPWEPAGVLKSGNLATTGFYGVLTDSQAKTVKQS